MKANCWLGKKKVDVVEVPDPRILNERDAIVRVTSTAICGSDLHLYNGFVPTSRQERRRPDDPPRRHRSEHDRDDVVERRLPPEHADPTETDEHEHGGEHHRRAQGHLPGGQRLARAPDISQEDTSSSRACEPRAVSGAPRAPARRARRPGSSRRTRRGPGRGPRPRGAPRAQLGQAPLPYLCSCAIILAPPRDNISVPTGLGDQQRGAPHTDR